MCSSSVTSNAGVGGTLFTSSSEVNRTFKSAEVHHLYNDFAIRTVTSSELSLRHFVHHNVKSISDNPKVIMDKVTRIRYRINVGNEANQIMIEPNAGGASVVSEALSMELMHRRFGATDVTTEMAIQYWCHNWKKIDYITSINGNRNGVSVTRAMGYPDSTAFTVEDADRLCHKKLFGLVVARAGISPSCSYDRSILHCFCQDNRIAELMKKSFEKLIRLDEQKMDSDSTLTGSIIIILTVCENFPEIFSDDDACIATVTA